MCSGSALLSPSTTSLLVPCFRFPRACPEHTSCCSVAAAPFRLVSGSACSLAWCTGAWSLWRESFYSWNGPVLSFQCPPDPLWWAIRTSFLPAGCEFPFFCSTVRFDAFCLFGNGHSDSRGVRCYGLLLRIFFLLTGNLEHYFIAFLAIFISMLSNVYLDPLGILSGLVTEIAAVHISSSAYTLDINPA